MTDWTDYRRSNPELEATRDRYNARFCGATDQPQPSLRPHFLIIVAAVLLIGMCLMASAGGVVS